MPVPLIAAGIGAVASIGGGLLASSAQKKAANQASDTALQTANQNNALTREIYGQNTANLQPFMQRGNEAGGALNSLLLGGPSSGGSSGWQQFLDSSGARSVLDEGQRATNMGYAARGTLQSGAAQKALQDRGQQQLLNNYLMPYMNTLQGQQGVGLSGANALAGVGTNMVNAVTANNNSAGSAAANAQLMAGQAGANMWGGVGNALGGLAGSFGSSYGKPASVAPTNSPWYVDPTRFGFGA